MKRKFDPKEWLNTSEPKAETRTQASPTRRGGGKASSLDGGVLRLPTNNGQQGTDNCQLETENLDGGLLKSHDSNLTSRDFLEILSRLESTQTDITASYSDWRDLGFALADEFGESGRDYFHRISRFYPGFSVSDCNKQYDACLKSNGHGITLKTFFHLAKQAGIDIRTNAAQGAHPSPTGRGGVAAESRDGGVLSDEKLLKTRQRPATAGPDGVFFKSPSGDLGVKNCQLETESRAAGVQLETKNSKLETVFSTPQLPPEIYTNLPEILRESCELFRDATEKDVFLIGSLAVLSGCLPNIQGIYFDEPVSAHLFVFITAPAGSGKGRMKWAKSFGQAIHDQMVEQSGHARAAYDSEMENYFNLSKKERQGVEKPEEPPRRMFYIPANSSSSAFIQALADNNFSGVIFETEADTLAGTFKQEWGNFSDVLRKAFHHESTSMFRRKDNEFIEIRDPHMAIALSGTPRQVHNIMPDTENGLFSRFLYYAFEDATEFKNPFVSHRPVNYTDFFVDKSYTVADLYQMLIALREPVSFRLTDGQAEQFTKVFGEMLSRNKLLLGGDFDANIKRLGLISFRVSMILTALRITEEGELPQQFVCSDLDFQTAMTIAATLEKHAIAVFRNMPNHELKGTKLKFYEALPDQFDRQGYLKVAADLGLNPKTAEKYIGQFKDKLLQHEHNLYRKNTA